MYFATLREHYIRSDSKVKTMIQIIRDLREDNDLTQAQVAQLLGTSQTMYARYERGANELPVRHLVALCKLYNISADNILGTRPDPRYKQGRYRG